MRSQRISYKLKTGVSDDTKRILTMFLSEWLDESVGDYTIHQDETNIAVDLDDPFDASVLILKGIPKEFSKLLEIR